ncbi:MAG TPA: succinylglutamate desuccinylase/aspartoacylase family protein [Thermomicrobiales bacterium]
MTTATDAGRHRPSWWNTRQSGQVVPVLLSHRDAGVTAYVATGSADGPVLTVLGAVHGDEYEGPVAIAELLAMLAASAISGTLIAVPVVNAPAYEAGRRTSPQDDKDLARCFPGDPNGTPSEQLAHLIATECIAPADALIDLHSGGVALDGALLIGYAAMDDDAGARSRELAYAFGAPVIWEHPPPMPPGRTGSFALERGIPFVYTEATGGGQADRATVACFIDGVQRVMVAMGMLPGDPPAPRHKEFWRGGGNTDTMVAAGVDGLFRAFVDAGQVVSRGTLVGEIVDFQGRVRERLFAPSDGVLPFIRRIPRVRVGDGLFMLTQRVGGDA